MIPIDLRRHIREIVEPSIGRLGFDLVAVEWRGGNRGQELRLTIDREGGVTAADCATISHHVSPLLDEADPISGAYTLQVSSPGIDRPVERIEDYQRFKGYRAKIRLEPGHPRRRYTGTIEGVQEEEVLLTVDGELHRLHLDAIETTHLVLSLDEYQALAEGLPALPAPETSHDDQ